MAENGESRSQLTGLLGPGLVVIIGGLVAYFTFEPALESLRPNLSQKLSVPPPPSPPHLHAVHSRLWDDPLTVAFQDSRNRPRGQSVAGGSLWEIALNLGRSKCAERDVSRYFKEIADPFLTSSSKANCKFLCLAVLIPGEPYEADTELRKRITYAVFSALTTCGYELSYPDRMSYVEMPLAISAVRQRTRVNLVVPTKLFERSQVTGAPSNPDGPDAVHVFWINEDQLGDKPLSALGTLLNSM